MLAARLPVHEVSVVLLATGVALLGLTLLTRAVRWSEIGDRRAQELAARSPGPLSFWALLALIAYVLAIVTAGDPGAPALAAASVLIAAAVLAGPATEPATAPAGPPPAPPRQADPPTAPLPAPTHPAMAPRSLWAGWRPEHPARRPGR